MCGFIGVWDRHGVDHNFIDQASNTIYSRGPDSSGKWFDSDNNILMLHRRLSILDLSSAGTQPMVTPCGRYAMVFNGEIYNHLEIRKEIFYDDNEFKWSTSTDTETLLVALTYWGMDRTLASINGMYAFALWDRKDKCLIIARDRFGEKPLYYSSRNGVLLFGSDLRSFNEYGRSHFDVDRNSVSLLLRYGHVPSPHSIYAGVSKLPPAHYMVFSKYGETVKGPTCYWRPEQIIYDNKENYTKMDEFECAEQLDREIKRSTQYRMLSDAPLGAFLSGGVDSTTIVAHMQSLSSSKVKTFSIGKYGDNNNEAVIASKISEYLGTEHTELYIDDKVAMSVVGLMPKIYPEPFADHSQIPTFLVSNLAKNDVKVALGGDGGDELFAGYNRHVFASGVHLNKIIKNSFSQKLASEFLMYVSRLELSLLHRSLSKGLGVVNLSNKLEKLAMAISSNSPFQYYQSLRTVSSDYGQIILNQDEYSDPLEEFMVPSWMSDQEMMVYLDTMSYLPNDILEKVDRASMSVSLEVRSPFLDPNLFNYAWSLPMNLKVRNRRGKWILRQALSKYIPESLMSSPKRGFGVPIGKWLRHGLNEWAEELLDESKLKEQGYFDEKLVRKKWESHLNSNGDNDNGMWPILMFQAWLNENELRG